MAAPVHKPANPVVADHGRARKAERAVAARAKAKSDVAVYYALMGAFTLIGIVFVGAALAALGAHDLPATHERVRTGSLPKFVFAAFWFGLSLMFLVIGRQAQKRSRKDG
jgi:hypothetical protein